MSRALPAGGANGRASDALRASPAQRVGGAPVLFLPERRSERARMAQTTITPAEPVRDALTRRFTQIQPYILLGQAYIFGGLLLSWGALENVVAVRPPTHVVFGLVGVGVAIIAPREATRHVFVSIPLMMLVTYMLCSVAWVTGLIPFRLAVMQTVPMVISTVFVASLLPHKRIIDALKVALLFGILLSFYAVITDPIARTHGGPAGFELTGWRGSFLHKNNLVPFLVLASVTYRYFEPRRWLRSFVYGATIVLTVGSQSSTGLSCIIVVVCSAWWLRAYMRQDLRLSAAYLVLSFFGAIAVAMAITALLPFIVSLYGKDLTFSNRTLIWEASLDAVEDQPLQGYGWYGVWIDHATEPTITMMRDIGFEAGHAHNSAIEMLLQGGILGLGLYVLFFGSVFVALTQALRPLPEIACWGLLMLVVQIVVGISEVTLFGGWLFFLVLVRGMLARELSTTSRHLA
jgi:exopolysaccharide production protein ExoQ